MIGSRRAYLVYGLCALGVGVAAVGEGFRTPPAAKFSSDSLVLATTYEPTTLHPVFGCDRMAAVEILGALFEPLTVFDDQHHLRPCLAREVPTVENGGLRLLPEAEAQARGGKMESVWHLRPDARWSDGEPVTAHDFIFTFRLIMDPDVPAVSRETEERIAAMEARDDGRTLVVLWKEPYAFAHEGHRHLLVPRHVEEPRFRALEGADHKEYERTPFNRAPVGNGPYRLAEWSPGRYLLLESNPFWHGPAPRLERVAYRFLPEVESILANLDTGRVGAVSPVALDFDLGYEYDQRARARGDTRYMVHYQPGLWWEHIDFNTENPLTADKRVRQALALGLNREAMSRTLFAGQSLVADTWLPPVHAAAFPAAGRLQPDLPRYPHDPRRAGELLDGAGWTAGPGGLRRKDRRPLRLPLRYPAGEPLTDRAAQMIKEDCRRIGVEVNLMPQDEKAFGDTGPANRSFQGLTLSLWIMDPSADGITFWTSGNIPTDANPAGQNTCRWRNARSDELLSAATKMLDAGERVRLLREQQRLWADELPAIPLFFKEEVSIRHRSLEGWRPTGTETPVTWNCHEWRWVIDQEPIR